MMKISKKTKKIILYVLGIAIILLAYYKLKFVRDVIFVIVASFILAYALKPIYKILINKVNINKKVIAAVLILGLIGIFIMLGAMLIPKIFNESTDFGVIIDNIENFINNIASKIKLSNSSIVTTLTIQASEKFNLLITEYSMKMFDAVIDFSENIISFAVIPVVAYYFLAYGEYISNKLLFIFPIHKRGLIKKFGHDIDKILGKYILGQLILSLIVGIMTFIAMVILKVKFPLLLSVLNALLNIVPYFGAILGALPAILVALIDGPMRVVWVVIAFIIIQQVEGNIIAPQVTASSIHMHPLTIIILLLIGDKLGGLVGMILIIPLAVVFKVLYEDIDYYLF